jgi:hypothetical protein
MHDSPEFGRLAAIDPAKGAQEARAILIAGDLVGEPLVGVGDTALEIQLAERPSRLGLQLDYRVRRKRMADMAMMATAGVGVAIVSGASAADLARGDLAIVPLEDAWAHRRLYLCARDFRRLPSSAVALSQALSTCIPSGAAAPVKPVIWPSASAIRWSGAPAVAKSRGPLGWSGSQKGWTGKTSMNGFGPPRLILSVQEGPSNA